MGQNIENVGFHLQPFKQPASDVAPCYGIDLSFERFLGEQLKKCTLKIATECVESFEGNSCTSITRQ